MLAVVLLDNICIVLHPTSSLSPRPMTADPDRPIHRRPLPLHHAEIRHAVKKDVVGYFPADGNDFMFINVKAYEGGPPPLGALIHEINPYDPNAYTLKGLSYNYQDGFGLPLPLSPEETALAGKE